MQPMFHTVRICRRKIPRIPIFFCVEHDRKGLAWIARSNAAYPEDMQRDHLGFARPDFVGFFLQVFYQGVEFLPG